MLYSKAFVQDDSAFFKRSMAGVRCGLAIVEMAVIAEIKLKPS